MPAHLESPINFARMKPSQESAFPRLAKLFEGTRTWSTLFTREQVMHVMGAWGVKEPVAPTKTSGPRYLEFSNGDMKVARITWSERKGTYNDRLYMVEMV